MAIDVYRREAVRPATALEDVHAGDPALQTGPESLESLFEVWEVREAVSALPDEEREVVRLQHFSNMTHDQIAERLSVAVGTVKSRSFRAHKRLAARLGHLRRETGSRDLP